MTTPIHNLTKKEIAAAFNLSVRTVSRLMRRRGIPFIYVGRTPRFCQQEVAEYFNAKNRVIARRAA